MCNIIDDPNQWLERAKDARQMAQQLEDHIMKGILEDIARSYERIADHVTRHTNDGGDPS